MPPFERDPAKFDLDLECPHCGNTVIAVPEAGPVFPRSPILEHYAYLICNCPKRRCDPLLVMYDRLNNRVHRVFPYPEVSERRYHQAIQDPVKADLAEADACWYGGSNKGVVAMCRRALQQMAQDKGAAGTNLINQIDDLLAKGLITGNLHKAAHEIRLFGNYGAHPQDDGLDKVSTDDAKAVRALTRDFVMDLYIRPHEIDQLKKSRTGP